MGCSFQDLTTMKSDLSARLWLFRSLLLGGCLLQFATLAWGASPSLGGLSPRGGQRGTEVEVTLSGGQLQDAQEVLFYEAGIEVTKFEVVNAGAVKAMFKILPEAELGSHRLRLRTATGITELRPFFVGALPEVAEKEPNSEFSTPQAITLNITVTCLAY